VKIRNIINRLDQTLSWVIITDITETMIGVMINIYYYSMFNNNEILKQCSSIIAFRSITSIMKLIIDCYINGLVHEESENILSILDEFDVQKLDETEFKEWITFKNISKDNKFGFTIGGFAALRKTTLIPVKMNFKTIIKIYLFNFFNRYLHSH